MKLKDGFVIREIAGQYLLIPTGLNIVEFNGAALLNEVSAFILSQMQEEITEDELVDAICSVYDVNSQQAAYDLYNILREFRELNILE
ncbi:MAG: PqqD family protein [Erysipelotrichaceae bacterium]|nr:PqqD family protein [Erysipelotrichaceae bacterium]